MNRRYFDQPPVGNTCPDIDAVIEVLAGVADRLDAIAGQLEDQHNADDLDTQAGNLRTLFEGRRSPLEELRTANETLRKWGNEQHEGAYNAEQEVKELRGQISELESQL